MFTDLSLHFHIAQTVLLANLSPQERQSTCRGESVVFACATNGNNIRFFGPPLVNESESLNLFSFYVRGRCEVRGDFATACVTAKNVSDTSSLLGTLTLYIAPSVTSGIYNVTCRTSLIDGSATLNSTTFRISGMYLLVVYYWA